MKIKALQGLRGDYGRLHTNQVEEVADDVGKSLIARGLAVEFVDDETTDGKKAEMGAADGKDHKDDKPKADAAAGAAAKGADGDKPKGDAAPAAADKPA